MLTPSDPALGIRKPKRVEGESIATRKTRKKKCCPPEVQDSEKGGSGDREGDGCWTKQKKVNIKAFMQRKPKKENCSDARPSYSD